ncbi:MAG TPA: 16S rRNA (cytosine(967)-C(5))-methyltransferase RsmB [Gemmatimonadales bacterium]|nr:16S rRNA (cytosine(967)-C(5))-methyltransferase RsmB [Gemmatimonadales bacterium]
MRASMAAGDARRAALTILELVTQGVPFDVARDRAVAELSDRDRRLAHELAAGVLRQQNRLDDALAPLVTRGLASLDPKLHRILRLGAYQLLALDRVPAHAAVSVAVDLARQVGGDRAAGFVNAVLRRVSRTGSAAIAEPKASGEADRLAHRFSHPAWLVSRWLDRYGPKEAESLLEWNNRRPDLVVQPARDSQDELLERFERDGLDAQLAPWGAGLVLAGGQPKDFPGYAEGAFVVQDPAQALVVRFAGLGAGATVLDACAAPGGKTIALGRTTARVIAADLDQDRVKRLAGNLHRAGREGLWAVVADAAAPPVRAVDAVLLDAPCLGTGTFARHPDARNRVRPAALRQLAERQAVLLDGIASVVVPGGLLIYATCSLEPEENEIQVTSFLARHPEFRRESSTTVPPELLSPAGDLSLFPPRHGTDGAYAARLRRAA